MGVTSYTRGDENNGANIKRGRKLVGSQALSHPCPSCSVTMLRFVPPAQEWGCCAPSRVDIVYAGLPKISSTEYLINCEWHKHNGCNKIVCNYYLAQTSKTQKAAKADRISRTKYVFEKGIEHEAQI